MLTIYREMFGKCWEHLLIVVTGVDFDQDNHETSEEYQIDLEKVQLEIKKEFKSRLNEDNSNVFAVSLKSIKLGKKRNEIWEEELMKVLS